MNKRGITPLIAFMSKYWPLILILILIYILVIGAKP